MDAAKAISRCLYVMGLTYKGYFQRIKFNRFLRDREKYSIQENLAIQNDMLYEQVDYAVKNTPYYRDLVKATGITYERDTITADLAKFPILTKAIIRDNFNSLHLTPLSAGCYENTSGGSTGEPVKFIQDRRYACADATLYGDAIGGYSVGDKLIRLWGSERDILSSTKSWKSIILNRFVYRTRFLNSFRMSEEDMLSFVEEINRYHPRTIIAYVQSAYELASFIERNGLEIYSPYSIIVSAGTLYPNFRKKIEKVFNCKVYNRYGSREIGLMGMECECQEGLHLIPFSNYVEILNEDGKKVELGEQGRIIVTSLQNRAMPLIRFDVGDVGTMTEETCPCGRGYPRFKSVVGRTVNIFKTKDGKRIDGEYFTHLFYFLDFIRKFQVIQNDYDRLTINIETWNDKDFENNRPLFAEMTKKIKMVMGDDCEVNYQLMEAIPPSPSGKFIFTYSNLE